MSLHERKYFLICRVTHFIGSLFLSFLFIWIVGYFFCDSIYIYKFDSALNKYVGEPGLEYRHRSEGNGSTHVGKYGINGIEDITKIDKRKIIIWGDSFVDARHVDDKYKLAQVVTSLLQKNSDNNVISFGVGMGGDSAADYYFDIPKYELIAQNVIAHFIIIHSMRDFLPNQWGDDERGIFKSDPYRLENKAWEPKYQKFGEIKNILNNLGLYFIWKLVSDIKLSYYSGFHLDFYPRIKKRTALSERLDEEDNTVSNFVRPVSFILGKLRSQTKAPIILVYCPNVPTIIKGNISFTDLNASLFNKVVIEASKNNIACLDLTGDFINYFKATGNFLRGFSNTRPGLGHLNIEGHRIVAEAIYKYTQQYLIH